MGKSTSNQLPIQRTTLTAQEVAEYLGLSIQFVYVLVQEKKLPCIRIGRRVLFKRDSIQRWLNEQEHGGSIS
ncbi:helix-turn-helix domain-containing protein [Evansella cellulosilytica]|uniref:DNA binding domain protein, excisionase family n=1 Tax=Evansella cellulosilytica (strain ATCC 21833 / DSM 2522 / FERM P-1141 / JCM 9156 / N-4) TaxID=649639 RepID=E6TVI8_EVAC2|nr:helix-turn-helix domain-containing protein [Evansella cellulosilytica]ADU31005.1 DNA binding domain protein, excisionase family [Evansella cellulosilytica DSM 2522]